MVTSFGPVALAAAIATIFGLLPLAISAVAVPRRPDRVKDAPYECGVETIGPTSVQFHNQFYLYALIFVIFDVEAVFFFPWAVTYGQLGLYALGEMAVFVGLLLVGYIYAWRKKALEWT
jgi:NADH:ubiquinone oxidoreductase subunit 3 (subunit A)